MTKKSSIEEMQALAKGHGGRCLSTVYTRAHEKLAWECSEGHRWEARASHVQQGSWCRQCSGYAKGTIEEMQQLAKERSGICLSSEYNGAHTPLLWQCAAGHTWQAAPTVLKSRGSWCPECSRSTLSYGERVARLILEAMFSVRLPKSRPVWLIGSSGRRLELDGFSEQDRMAFEYHGYQHYEPAHWSGEATLADQTARDARKAQLCAAHGIRLIVIPEFPDRRNLRACIEQVEFCAIWAGLKPPRNWKRPVSLVGLDDPLERVFGAEGLRSLHKVAAEHGGSLVSLSAAGKHGRLTWRCREGHLFNAKAADVENGWWCRSCFHAAKGRRCPGRPRRSQPPQATPGVPIGIGPPLGLG